MRKDFSPFSTGDKVLANTSHPYYNKLWLNEGTVYTVDRMISVAGVLTLEGFPYNKTFPEDVFILLEKNSETNSSNEGSST